MEIPNTHTNDSHFPDLVQVLLLKNDGSKLVLWAPLNKLVRSWECFPRRGNIPALTKKNGRTVLISSTPIMNILHNIS